MKKIFTILGMVAVTATVSAQTSFTVTYDFAEPVVTGQGVVDNGTIAGSSDVTVTPFTQTGLNATTTANRFVWSNATTATTPDLAKYFEVTVTPATNFNLSISSVTFRSQRSGTGPRYYVVRSSVDSYGTNLPASINPANTELEVVATDAFHFVNDGTAGQNGSTVTPTNITNQTTPVTFRFYYYEAEAATGTFSVDDVVITGTVTNSLGVVENFSTKSNFVRNTMVNNEINFGTKAEVKVYNMNGQVVRSASVSENNNLEVSDLAPGMYIVTGTVNGEAVSQKILKK